MSLPAGRWAGAAVGVFWGALALAALVLWLWRWPEDLFSALLALGLCVWALAATFGWRRARLSGRRERVFAWAGLQLGACLLLAGLGAAELAARWSESRWERWERQTPDYEDAILPQEDSLRLPHQGGLLKRGLDLEVKGARRGETVTFRANKLGTRNLEEIAVQKPANTIRVLFLGDSFIAGYRMSNEEVFGAQLREEILKRSDGADLLRGKRLEVLNIMTQDPVTTWLYLDEHAAALAPDLVVCNICLANDFFQALVFLGDPPRLSETYFSITSDGALRPAPSERFAELRDAIVSYIAADASPYPASAFRDSAKSKPAKKSPSPWRVARVLQGVVASFGEYQGASQAPRRSESLFHFGQTAIFLRERPASIQSAYDAMRQSLAGWARWSREHQTPVIVTAIPTRYQVIRQDREATFEQDALRAEAFDLEAPTSFLAEICDAEGLGFVDFAPGFSALGDDAWRYFLPGLDCHWNAAGYGEAARLLAPEVMEALRAAPEAQQNNAHEPEG